MVSPVKRQRQLLLKELEKIQRQLKVVTGIPTRRKLTRRMLEIKKELKKKN